ncbi:hypothetical protein [Candidatus Electrothrix sp.]|uniref:hypothetical protein n=2 Tax=Candidatus Electrothrix sp. TaxID=2170559 RepID=UPI0040567F77
MKSTKKKALFCLLASFFLFACDKKEKEEVPPLKQEAPKPVTMLDVVPADTIFFSGGLQPFPLTETLQWSADNFAFIKELDPDTLYPLQQDVKIPGQRMAVQLWLDYYAMMVSPETEMEKWGIQEKPLLATYTVGLAPVLLRISLKDVQAFQKKVDALEAKAEVTSTHETLGKASYRRYALTEKNEKHPSVDLIIGVDNERKHAVFMLDIGVDSEQTLAIALGQQKPEKALAETGRVEALIKQYKLHPAWVGYLDHQQLITGLITKEGNSVAKMMQSLTPQIQGTTPLLDELQTEGCRNDVVAMGKNWPQTVFGYTALELAAPPSRINSLIVVENKDKALLDGLQSLRGFVPQYVKNPAQAPIAAFGLGLNIEKIAPFLTERWTAITQKQYSCSFLKEMQEDVKSQQPAALAMMTGMAPGVQGLALSLMSLELENAEQADAPPMPKTVDALISLAVKNPTNFVQMIGTFFPPLAELQIPADGTPVQLPLPVPLPFPVMAAINGSHLTVYVGEQSQALSQALGSESLEASKGLLATNVDYGKYYSLIGDSLTSLDIPDAQKPETQAVFEAMKDVNMQMQMNMDVTERGIEFQVNMATTE